MEETTEKPLKTAAPGRRRKARIWIIVSVIALSLRLLLGVLTRYPGPSSSAAAVSWPVHGGDVMAIGPKNGAIEKWAEKTSDDDRFFLVRLLERGGVAVKDPAALCALDPDFINNDGGKLTFVEQAGQSLPDLSHAKVGQEIALESLWRVKWQGHGGSLWADPKGKKSDDGGCGTDAVILMSEGQIKEWLDIVAGRPITSHHRQATSL